MAVQDTLAFAGRPACGNQAVRLIEGHRDRQVFVGFRGQNGFVTLPAPITGFSPGDADCRCGIGKPVCKIRIGDNRPAIVIVHIFGDIRREQADVERGDNGANPCAGKNRLDDCVFVPEHCRNHIAFLNAGAHHRAGEPGDACIELAIGQPTVAQQVVYRRPVRIKLRPPRHDKGDVCELPFRISQVFHHFYAPACGVSRGCRSETPGS